MIDGVAESVNNKLHDEIVNTCHYYRATSNDIHDTFNPAKPDTPRAEVNSPLSQTPEPGALIFRSRNPSVNLTDTSVQF